MYNPYNPYAYLYPNNMPQTPFQGQQAPFQSPGMNLPQNTQAVTSAAPVVLQVATIKQVEQAQVQPGGKALVLVANEPVIAMRTADNMGITSTDYYHIEKFDPEAQMPAQSANWVTHEELQQALAQQMKNFVDSLKPKKTKEAAE